MQWHYKPRWMAERLREAISFSPIVVLTGPRQTGKSTLLRQEAPFRNLERGQIYLLIKIKVLVQ